VFFKGPGDRVMLAVDLFCPVHIVREAFVVLAEPADIQWPDIEARFALHDPFGQHPAGAAACRDTEGIEPDSDKTVLPLRRRPEHAVAIGRKGLRSIYQAGNAGILEARRPFDGSFGKGSKMVIIGLQELLGESFGDTLDRPGNAVPFITAHDEAPTLLLVIEKAVLVPQGGEVGRQPRNRLGDQILMLKGDRRNVHPHHLADLPAPHTGCVYYRLTSDRSLVGNHGLDTVFFYLKTGHRCLLLHFRTAIHGPFSHGHREAAGIGLPVGRHECRADDALHIQDREYLQRLPG
jgi:hypothetical protein